jgi:DNA-binding response OmpR family regulator
MQIVLIEADGRALPFVRELLVSFADHVLIAPDGAAAIRAGSGGISLLVVARAAWESTDVVLCREVHAARLPVPLLVISGPCPAAQRSEALRAGADDFLSIPFDVEEVPARAYALVRRATSGSRHARAGAFSVDFARRQIHVDGRRITLTLAEYDLLATLIDRAGEVVTRKELVARLASGAQSADSNVIDVHMSHIRDKLGDHSNAIETMRGLGYRFRR